MMNSSGAESMHIRRVIQRVEETNRSINAGIADQQRVDVLEKLELRLGDAQKGQVLRRLSFCEHLLWNLVLRRT